MHVLLLFSFVFLASPNSSSQRGWCEGSPQTRQALKRVRGDEQDSDEARSARLKEYRSLLAVQPLNLDLQLAYQADAKRNMAESSSGAARDLVIKEFREQAQLHPAAAEWQYLYANALLDADTPQATRIAETWAVRSPLFPRTHLLLANIYSWGKFKDPEKADREVEKFYQLCPGSLNPVATSYATRLRSPERAAAVSAALRKRLEKESDPELLDRWETVWALDFKAHPPTEHDAIRQQIKTDLKRLVKFHPTGDAAWYFFLSASYKSAGDLPASKQAEDTILAKFPQSRQASRLENERWYKAHPYPRNDQEKQKAFNQASLDRTAERLKLAPRDVNLLWTRFNTLSQLDSTTNDQLTQAAGEFLAQYEKNPGIMMFPAPQIQIANAYVKRKIHIEQVPSLVESGRRAEARFSGPPSDRDLDEARSRETEIQVTRDLQTADTLASAALAVGKPDMAREAMERIASVPVSKPWLRSMKLNAQAKFAEAEGRRLDALLLYRTQLDTRTDSEKPKGKDELAETVSRLKKELGATAATDSLWSTQARAASAAAPSAWSKPDKPWKAWQLTDLAGKTWKLADLQGKTVLVNVWATWCGPCRDEHPHLQKLYEQLKNRSDVQIVSFNVDQEIGQIAPYRLLLI